MRGDAMKNGFLLFVIFALTACSAAVNPTAAIPATATTVPTSTTIPVPTATLTPTAVPVPTATLTPTAVPSDPCDNPLVPLVVGNQWTYRVTTDSGESLYTLTALERKDAANIVVMVEFTDQKRGSTLQEPVVCRDGAIVDFPLFTMNMFFSDYLTKFFKTYHDQGDYSPAYASFAEKNWIMDWQPEYETEDAAFIKNPMGGPDLVVLQASPINLSFRMDGSREPVTVPAGNFPQAIKVSHMFTMPLTITLPTGGMNGLLTVNDTQWYEPYVGLVRAQVDSVSLDVGTQINVPMKSIIELIEFKPGSQ
jgi:hypothetical protein